jgi:hypothetical protein
MDATNSVSMAMQIVAIPWKFHNQKNKSIIDLVKETGYFEQHDQITEGDIQTALLCRPEYVQEWRQYSEDQRSSDAWCLNIPKGGPYEVGCPDANPVQYNSAIDACAAFIQHEIEEIRTDDLERTRKHKETVERKRALNRARNL